MKMATKGCLLILIGLPGSGKTTLCRQILNQPQLEFDKKQFLHLNYDEMVDHKSFDSDHDNDKNLKTWRKSRLKIEKILEELLQRLIHNSSEEVSNEAKHLQEKIICVDSPTIFLVDDNMYYSSMRYRWFQIARKYNIGYCQVFLKCDVAESKARNRCRVIEERVLDEVIERMDQRLEVPNGMKNYWEKNSIEISLTLIEEEKTWTKIIKLIQNAVEYPVQPLQDNEETKVQAREECLQNIVHQADQILRKLVGEAIRNSIKGEGTKLSYQDLNKKRLRILDDIKSGVMKPEEMVEDEEANGLSKLKRYLSDQFRTL